MKTGIDVMSVDDSKVVHSFVTEVFAETNVKLEHCFNGKEAIDAISRADRQPPDLILLDWEMPVMSGIEALPELRKKLPNTPIIMSTSKNAMADIVTAIDCGATDYVMKPFTRDILISKIESVIGRKVA
jgi:two-component system chemotaxis response regulator CheY